MSKTKRDRVPFVVYFSPEEREELKKIALQDTRDESGELRWLVTAYAKGELVTIGKLTALLARYEQGIPVLRGELGQLVAEGKPAQEYPQKKEGPHRKK